MGLRLEYEDGQTPIDNEEKEGLFIKAITNHGELNELEQLNIENALEWIMRSKFKTDKILTEDFILKIHKKMFGDVWRWAGKFRKSEKNIGVDWIKIGIELRYLLDDTTYWIENKTYSPDEIAIRFKHRLVKIHCFSNGNGRHSRLMADIIIQSIFGMKAFTWHHSSIVKPDEVRKKYIDAIKESDNGNITPLIDFARS